MASSLAAGVRADGINQDVLSRVRHLDVTQNITDRSQKTVAHGGYCEVFTASLHRIGSDQVQVQVAVKRLRFHTGETKVMEAGPSLLPEKNSLAHKICAAICQGSLHMVKAVSSKHLAVARLCHL